MEYSITCQVPCPTVQDVGGRACMKIGDTISHHLAMGHGFEYTETPTKYISYGIHVCKAMYELLNVMKDLDPVEQPPYMVGLQSGPIP